MNIIRKTFYVGESEKPINRVFTVYASIVAKAWLNTCFESCEPAKFSHFTDDESLNWYLKCISHTNSSPVEIKLINSRKKN